MRHVPARQVELGERCGRDLAGVTDGHRPSGRQIKGALQTTTEHIRSRDASLQQVLDASSRLARRERGRGTHLDCRSPQCIEVSDGILACRFHVRHGLLEVGCGLHRIPEPERCDTANLQQPTRQRVHARPIR